MDNVLTAAQALALSNEKNLEGLSGFFDQVREECERKNTGFNYSGDLTKEEKAYLRSLGYDIYRNSACLWYEVSWAPEET